MTQRYDAKIWLLLQWYLKGEPPSREQEDKAWKPDLDWTGSAVKQLRVDSVCRFSKAGENTLVTMRQVRGCGR